MPTTRYTVTAYHPNASGGKPLVMSTYDTRTVEEAKTRFAAMGYDRVEVKVEAVTP